MMAHYDEDLHENPFFQTLVGKYGSLFAEAAENRWRICVPRVDSVSRLKLSRADCESHILRPIGEPHSRQLVSVNNKNVTVDTDILRTGQGYREPRAVKILFEEDFFNSRDESYQVFCIDQPLEGALGEEVAIVRLESLEDCCLYLWSDAGTEKVKRSVDRLLEFFHIEGGTLRAIMDTATALYTRAVQELFKLRKFQVFTQKTFCKLAVETYVMDKLHPKVFKELCFLVAVKDAALNKITRNLSDTPPHDLGIKAQYRLRLSAAKSVLSQLNQFSTPLGKLYCFKRCITEVAEMEGGNDVLTADELLPILVYLVIVTDIPNWNGNLMFIHKFHFSNVSMDEFAYYMTSFEAAVEYLCSESDQLASIASSVAMQRIRSSSSVTDEITPIDHYFKRVCAGEAGEVGGLLDQTERDSEAARSRLCHPLCTCPKCSVLENSLLDDSHRVTVYLRDSDGRSGLHHAARMGHLKVAQLLLTREAIVNATDHHCSTPLHLASQKGHQACTLLLLGEGCSVNLQDNSGNTALHLACSNGHEECVKSLLFNTREGCRVNVANNLGDTPLHNAARWGYASIVSVLIEHGADASVCNKQGETPSQCAQSRRVQQLLGDSAARKQSTRAPGDRDPASGRGQSSVARRRLRSEASLSETDRLLKKIFKAIQDSDIVKLRYLFGLRESSPSSESDVAEDDLCHPLCQCDKCCLLRKSHVFMEMGGISVNSCDKLGQTPLHMAALQGHRSIVELLLRHGADIDVPTRDKALTPLHLACQYNHKDVVLILLEHGAQVNPCNKKGNSPLHFACNNGHMESATILLIHGADVSITNSRGDTPLHSAARWNHPHIANELLLYGAQYSVTNREGKTAIQLSRDDEVKLVINKAMRGEISVGSYRRPLATRLSPDPQLQPARLSPDRHASPEPALPGDRGEEGVGEGEGEGDRGGDSSPVPVQRRPNVPSHPSPTATNLGRRTEWSEHDDHVYAMMRAIESFDRTASLRRSVTYDRSAPLLPSYAFSPLPPPSRGPQRPSPDVPTDESFDGTGESKDGDEESLAGRGEGPGREETADSLEPTELVQLLPSDWAIL